MLSVDRSLFRDGEDALRSASQGRRIGEFLRDLQRYEGVVISDWFVQLEWHDDGFPHWHLFIEVAEAGKAGMIGGDVIREHWRWARWVKEIPIWSEDHWKNLLGYFGKHGYFNTGKGHQSRLPSWAMSGKVRFKRWQAMHPSEVDERKKLLSTMRQEESSYVGAWSTTNPLSRYGLAGDCVPVMAGDHPDRKTYAELLASCGASCEVTVWGGERMDKFACKHPYSVVASAFPFQYVKGMGLVMDFTMREEFHRVLADIRALMTPAGGPDGSTVGGAVVGEGVPSFPLRGKGGPKISPGNPNTGQGLGDASDSEVGSGTREKLQRLENSSLRVSEKKRLTRWKDYSKLL